MTQLNNATIARTLRELQTDINVLYNAVEQAINGRGGTAAGDTYTKQEIDDKIDKCATNEELANYYNKTEVDSAIASAAGTVSNLNWDTDVLRSTGVVTIGENDTGTLYVGNNITNDKYGIIQLGTAYTGTGSGTINVGVGAAADTTGKGVINVGVSDTGSGNGSIVVGKGKDKASSTGGIIVGSVDDGATSGILIKSAAGVGEIKVNGKKVLVEGEGGGSGSANVSALTWDTDTLTGKAGVVRVNTTEPQTASSMIVGKVTETEVYPARYVAVAADGSNYRCATSEDGGVTWTGRNNLSMNNGWQAVCSGGDVLVAVAGTGTDDRCATSEDGGVTWTGQSSIGNDKTWQHVTFGNGKFVAVAQAGDAHRCVYSTDGKAWTASTSLPVDAAWMFVTHAGGDNFVAVAQDGSKRCAVSTDGGITWNTSTDLAADRQWKAVAYDGTSKLVAISYDGADYRCATSENGGTTWTTRNGLAADRGWRSVCYGNGKFVAVSEDGSDYRCATSTDGITWNGQASLDKTAAWKSVQYVGGKFIATSDQGSDQFRCAVSDDGETWTNSTSLDPTGNWSAATYVNRKVTSAGAEIVAKVTHDGDASITVGGKKVMIEGSHTVTHEAPFSGSIERYKLRSPVYATGKVKKFDKKTMKWTDKIGNTDCICEVKESGTVDEFVGVLVAFMNSKGEYVTDTKGGDGSIVSVVFATHGDYLFTVPDSSKVKVGDLVKVNGTVVGKDEAVTVKVLKSIVGKCVGVVDRTTVALMHD